MYLYLCVYAVYARMCCVFRSQIGWLGFISRVRVSVKVSMYTSQHVYLTSTKLWINVLCFTDPLHEAPTHVSVLSLNAGVYTCFLPNQVSSATARRRPAACTRCWRCPTRGRTCPWWSFCLGRRCHWLPWSPSSKRPCWRSGPTTSNGRRWKSTSPGVRWRNRTLARCYAVSCLWHQWASRLFLLSSLPQYAVVTCASITYKSTKCCCGGSYFTRMQSS